MDIYWDTKNRLLYSANHATARISNQTFILADELYINLRLVEPASSGDEDFNVVAPPSGYGVVCGMRETSEIVNGALLAMQDTWSFDTNHLATASLNLYTDNMVAAIGSDSYIDCTLEFTLRNSTTLYDRDSTQITVRVKYDVIRSDSVTPGIIQSLAEHITHTDGRKGIRLRNADGTIVATFLEP